ncbi:MAG: 1-acyl-sn-glycerol-3-phosphate acyltransferase [Clostridia bacterium]|nr:1-acyl-sn-glycerol-3-phosphate acyltransferase [Clostridia bacterium]
MIYLIIRYGLWPLLWLIFHPKVCGAKNLFVKGKAIIVCNHRSLLDPVLLAITTLRPIHFMAKAELFESKLGNLFFRSLYAFPVHRKTADLTSLKKALKVLEQNKIFGIFPEGKRAVTGELDEFEKGASLLAVKSKSPIIPVYIQPESYRSLFPKMRVGEPIDVESLAQTTPKSQLLDAVHMQMTEAVKKLKAEAEAESCR